MSKVDVQSSPVTQHVPPLCMCCTTEAQGYVSHAQGLRFAHTSADRVRIKGVEANKHSPFVSRPRRGPLSNLPLIAVSVALVWGLTQTAGIWKNVTSKSKKDEVCTRSSLSSARSHGQVSQPVTCALR